MNQPLKAESEEHVVEEEIAKIVKEHGWFGANVYDNEPPFVYTIGLMETFDHPELIVFGLERNQAWALVQGIIQHLREGERFTEKEVRSVCIGTDVHRVGFRRVDPTQHPLYLGYAMGYCRHIGRIGELEAMQCFWPDGQGKFPFEAGFTPELSDSQPRLDIPLTSTEIADFERQFDFE